MGECPPNRSAMLRTFAILLRVLMLLATFTVAMAGHHAVAVAGSAQHHVVETPDLSGQHGHAADACTQGHCGTAERSCCAMGQCMLALGVEVTPDFPAVPTEDPLPAHCAILHTAAVSLPFRPPTV